MPAFASLAAPRRFTVLALALLPLTAGAQRTRLEPPPPPSAKEDTLSFRAVEWRNIGPFRGGRVTAVAGVPSQPLLYYMGATGGGVWRTEDGGANWRNISDKFFRTGSVGAIAVAATDPNVIYVGMGEAPIRGVASSYGDGVYKSTDAGRTWTHLGLDATRQISKVIVHPRDPDVVWVAAQGARWGPTNDRGIYKSTDGGRSWKQVHSLAEKTAGASDLTIDPTNPRILYAGYWDHQRLPWQVRSGGPGSGIWKSTDGGETWKKLTEGLPKGTMGKIGIAVSANPDRVYAIIEADSGGLYRTDDAGKTWRRMNEDRLLRARAWYYTHITADPQNADVVYVMNAPLLRSVDGGRTFQTVATPHGDNHALWINPTNSAYMINGNDGGANVSFNAGRTWSTQDNQPTAQFYRVNADQQFPYRLYGGQQDNTSVIIPGRTTGYGIDRADWTTGPGCESAYLDFDPKDPRYVYGGCYQGIIEEWDRDTEYRRNVMAYPALGLGEPSSEQRYRFNWNAPIITSPHDRKVLYHAGNVLFTSRDRGQSWSPISPDLTRNEKAKQGPGGAPITNEGAGAEVYGTIFYVAESPLEAGTIWAGTDDGLVQLTRDGGKSWSNVTPRGLAEALV
ncbi:MAG TPA: glycosyl hydrolase, partial [Gemmatimonadaceae bacterium]|nr:glycosyl hydrolase [Gemmatimonadaceae bacterium]